MMIEKQVDKYVIARRRRKRWQKVVSALAAIVVFCTTYALILPAITEQAELYCGMEEHIHSDDCYEEQSVLRCEKEETDGHIHSDACYTEEAVLTCTAEKPGHVHDDSCYEMQKVLTCEEAECEAHHHDENCFLKERALTCEKEEQNLHQHTLQCYSNPEADVESDTTWENSFASAELTRNWAEDILSIARTQLSYEESTRNYMVEEDGVTTKGYTRYGDWYGDAYGEWDAMFCAFCIDYAGVENYPLDADCGAWVEKLSEQSDDSASYYHPAGEYTPEPGDLVFFDWDEVEPGASRSPEHVGFVCEVIEATETSAAQLCTIEGDSDDCVKYMNYALDDSRIMGYGEMAENSEFNQEITSGGEDFNVDVQYSEKAELPDDTKLETTEIAEGSEAYDAYYQQVLECLPKDSRLAFCRLFDISLMEKGGETEPSAPVETTITLDDTPLQDDVEVGVLHFAENGPEFLEPTLGVNEEGQNTVSFAQSGFSVVALYGLEPAAESGAVGDASGGGTVVKPDYPGYIAPSGAKNGETSVGDVAGKYWSDPATSQLEGLFNGVAADDGKVLTDKSVIYGKDDYNAFDSYSPNTFGVTLSALGQTYPLTEELNVKVPIDVVFVLDTSGSMIDTTTNNGQENSASIMVQSLNDIMDYILKENDDNRVGVVCFSGGGHELLKLGHYTEPNGEYFQFQNGKFTGDHDAIFLQTSGNLRLADGTEPASHTFTGWWGTYTQHGIATGAQLFLETTDTTVTRTATKQLEDGEKITATYTVPRRPVFILLSDGDPTYCTASYDDVLNASDVNNKNSEDNISGNGNSGYQNNKGVLGYYTILSAQSYKKKVTDHYNTDAYFYSIGIGMNETEKKSFSASDSGDDYKRAVLNPSTANINAIENCTNGDGHRYSNTTCHMLYKLLNNTYTYDYNNSKVSVLNYGDGGKSEASYGVPSKDKPKPTIATVKVKKNPFSSTGYNYADGAFFTKEATVEQLTQAFKDAVNFSKDLTVYGFILKNNKPITVSDTIGAGMELKSEPILRYGGANYAPVSHNTSGNVTTYHYSGIYQDAYSGATVDLSNITAQVETVDGKQTVRLLVPDAQLPAYLPEMDNENNTYFYYEALPARLIYQVGLTEKSEEAVRALEFTGGELTYYTNEWSPDNYAFSHFEPTTKNPYYKENTYNRDPLEKGENTTGTRKNAWEYGASCNAAQVTEYLGNNGKLTFSSEKHESVQVTLRKVDEKGKPMSVDTAKFEFYKDAALTRLAGVYETDANGVVTIPALRTDCTYYIKEVKAPNGFALLSEPLVFTIGADKKITLPEPHDPHIRVGEGLELYVSNDIAFTRVEVWKRWAGELASGESYPDSVQFQLYADGKPYGEAVTCNSDNEWKCAWEELPVLSEKDHHEIVYTVEELNVPDGYQVIRETGENGEQIITNFKISRKSLSVQKKWEGDGTKASFVQVELMIRYKNGTEKHTGKYVTLNEENDWFYKWKDLVNCDENGEIEYFVREIAVDGYEGVVLPWKGVGDPNGQTAVFAYKEPTPPAFEDGGQYLLVLNNQALTVNSAGNGLAFTSYDRNAAAAEPTLWEAKSGRNGYTLTSVSTGKSLKLDRELSWNGYNYYVTLSANGSTAWSLRNNRISGSYNYTTRYWTASLNNNRLEANSSGTPVTLYKYELVIKEKTPEERGDFAYIIVNTSKTEKPNLSLNFRKVREGEEPAKALAGAEFKLYRETGIESDSLIPQTTDRYGKLVDAWESQEGTSTKVTLTKNGIYYLVETKAPIGFVAREEPIVFEVIWDGSNWVAKTLEGDPISDGRIFIDMDIPNTFVGTHELPQTGGMGTTGFYILGTVLAAGALLLQFGMRRRREREEG